MAKEIHGWTGRILRVDLDRSEITELNTMDYTDLYLGGRGIATKIYWDEVGPDVGALDPENRLILMCGALTGTGAQGATRSEIISKSPMLMPEGFCYGSLGGYLPAHLKKAGYDGVVVSGRADKPSYIWINDGKAEILDASSLWGKGTFKTGEILQEKHGKNVHYITTGQAGEKMCRNATVIADHEGSTTGGFGAVMGSKNLKAIAVVGTGNPSVAGKSDLTALNREIIKISKRGTLRMPVPKKQMEFLKTSHCYQCGIECGRGLYKTASGREVTRKCQSMIMYMMWAGARPDETIETTLDATDICNDYSICTMEMQSVLMWLGGCYQNGVLSDKDTGLDFSTIGSRDFIEQLISMISNREGFGDILAEGIMRAGEKLGHEAKGLFHEYVYPVGFGSAYSPRQYRINTMLYAVEPRQPIAMLHDVSHLIARWLLHRIRPNLSITSSEVFRKAAVKHWKSEKAWDMTTFEGKAVATSKVQDHTCAKDSLGLCDFGWPIMDSFNTEDNTGDPTLQSRLFSVVTGIETDEAGLELYGERVVNLQRAVLLREGWKPPEDDSPPEFNFTTPVQMDPLNPELIVPGPADEPVSVKGAILDRKEFEAHRKEFYEFRGWDPETGLQKAETLVQLGLSGLAEELKKMGLVK